MSIELIEEDLKDIEIIKPLWEQLNKIHFEKSVYFKEKYKNFTFEKRMRPILKRTDKVIKLDVLLDNETGNYVGYCLSSIEDTLGEIESIFIEKKYRKFGLGGELMKNALKWFKLKNISKIQIGVVYDNDGAVPFYERYGFHIGSYILKQE